MLKGTTESGFAFEIDEKNLDNMELLDALVELQDDDPMTLSSVCKLLLGESLRKKLYEHVRAEDGRVPIQKVGKELENIMKECGQKGKN